MFSIYVTVGSSLGEARPVVRRGEALALSRARAVTEPVPTVRENTIANKMPKEIVYESL